MHLLYHFSVMGALFSTCFAYTINWSGSQPRCRLSQGRIQSIYNIVEPAMADTAVFSHGQTIACSALGSNGLKGFGDWGFCAWIGNGGGNVFNKAKILSLLDNLLQPSNSGQSCGSTPIDYPLLNNSYNALTVNYVYSIPCIGYCSNNQDRQGTLPNNDRGYAPGTCSLSFMQYQGFTGPSDAPTYIKTGLPATTYMDVQIVDANRFLVGGTWFQESPSGQTWDLPSKLPAMLLIGLGTAQSDAINFAYNGAEFNTSSNQCSLSGFKNGARFGNCNFPCVEDTTPNRHVNGTVNRYVKVPVNESVNGSVNGSIIGSVAKYKPRGSYVF